MGWHLTKEAAARVRNSHLLSVFEQDEGNSTEEDMTYLEWQIITYKEMLLQAYQNAFIHI